MCRVPCFRKAQPDLLYLLTIAFAISIIDKT